MMRIIDDDVVHFASRVGATICGRISKDLFGEPNTFVISTKPVTCPKCAEVYCRIKNAPWNEVDDAAMDRAIYDAVKKEDAE